MQFPRQALEPSLGKEVYKFPHPVPSAQWRVLPRYKQASHGEQALPLTLTCGPKRNHKQVVENGSLPSFPLSRAATPLETRAVAVASHG